MEYRQLRSLSFSWDGVSDILALARKLAGHQGRLRLGPITTLLAVIEGARAVCPRGTAGALKQVLHIYLGVGEEEPVIVEQAKDLEPYTFKVILPVKAGELNR